MSLEKEFFDYFENIDEDEWNDSTLFRTHLHYHLYDSGWRTIRENDMRTLQSPDGQNVMSWYSPRHGGIFESKSDAMNFIIDNNLSDYFFVIPVIAVKVNSIKEILLNR